MQKLVFTNGGGQSIDLTSGNFGITNWEGLSGVGLNIQTQQVPFQDGGVFLDALMEQREISVTVAIQDNNDLSARYERKRQLISALNPKLGEGVLVYTNDYLSRQIKAAPQLPIFENKNSNDAGTLKASVTFSCCLPYWEDLEDTVVAFGFNDQPIVTNNGDVPAQLNIEWETNDITNGTIENVTQKQKITYNGTLENNLHINTNVGQKSVSSERMGFEIVDTGSRNEISAYAKGIETTITIAIDGTGFLSKDGEEWQSVTVTNNVPMYSVVYANNLHRFVAVGERRGSTDKMVRWSDDGITWNNAVGTFSARFYQTVVYSEDKNLFVAVGADGYIIISADGREWTHITSGVASTIYGVCYSEMDGLFVAVGAGGIILTSSNGTTWTQRTSGATETDVFRRVCHSEKLGLFVAVLNSDNGYISTDGINWTIVNIPLQQMAGLCYSEITNKFLAVGAGGTVAISLDGTTWTTVQIQGTTERLYSACYSNNIKRFFTTGGTGALYTSTDGLVWEIGKTGLNGTYRAVIYVEELGKYFIAGNRLGQNNYLSILSSETFGNWEECYISEVTDTEVPSISYYNNTIIVCASNKGYFTSQDGINWTRHTDNASKIIFVEAQNKYFRIYGTQIFSSTDLENWDTVTTLTNVSSLIDICYSTSKHTFVVVGRQNSHYCAYSTDGVNWIEVNINPSSFIGSNPAIAFSEELGIFVIAGAYVFTSYDGINWAKRMSLISDYSRCIIYTKVKNQFLIGGRYVSSNGINWSDVSNYKQLLGVIYSEQDNCYYGVGGTTTIKSYVIPIGNCIDKLSADSNIGMNLALGDNLFRVTSDSGDMSVVLRYRQKYIGV